MHLSQLDPGQADRFGSAHRLYYDLPDGRSVLMLSGVVQLDLRAPGWSSETAVVEPYRVALILDLLIPEGFKQQAQRFRIDQSLPYVGMSNLVGVANVQWGVNTFAVDAQQSGDQTVRLLTDLEVARSSEVLKSISYSLTLLGAVVD
jgi:hypothetical protein